MLSLCIIKNNSSQVHLKAIQYSILSLIFCFITLTDIYTWLMKLLVATAVTAWATPPPMNILREGSYWKCLSNNSEVAGCHVLSDKRTKSKIKQNSVLRNLKLFKKRGMGTDCSEAYFILDSQTKLLKGFQCDPTHMLWQMNKLSS